MKSRPEVDDGRPIWPRRYRARRPTNPLYVTVGLGGVGRGKIGVVWFTSDI